MNAFVVESYRLPPGCCIACGLPRTPAVATGIDVDQPGVAYSSALTMCHLCILTMARMVGERVGYKVIATVELGTLNDRIHALEAALVDMTDERNLAYAARNALLDSLAREGHSVVEGNSTGTIEAIEDEGFIGPPAPTADQPPPKKPVAR